MPAVAASRTKLDTANGRRGSRAFRAEPRYGAMAPPAATPRSMSMFIQGSAGRHAYCPSSTHGGARKADEVAAHTIVSASAIAGAADPSRTANGSERKAVALTIVSATIIGPS